MNKEEIIYRIRVFLENHVGNNNFSNSDDLFSQGFVSSLFAMELVNFVETEFNIIIDDIELKLDNFRSVDAISKLVTKLSK